MSIALIILKVYEYLTIILLLVRKCCINYLLKILKSNFDLKYYYVYDERYI